MKNRDLTKTEKAIISIFFEEVTTFLTPKQYKELQEKIAQRFLDEAKLISERLGEK